MRRFDLATLCTPARAAVFAAAALLCAFAMEWRAGRQTQLPLEPLAVATSLASGTGFANPFWQASGPTAWVTPAIPFIYAGALVASRWLGISAFNLILAANLAAIAAAVYLILKYCIPRWSGPGRVACVVAFLGYCQLDGNVLTYPGALTAAECALLLAGLSVGWQRPGSLRGAAMLFAADTLLALTHPGLALAGLAATVALALAAGRTARGRSVGLLRSGLLAAAAAVLVGAAPWAIRNRLVFHQWIAAKSNGYFELVLAHEQTADGILTESSILYGNPSTNLRIFRDYQRLGERAFLDGYRRRAIAIVTQDTGRYLRFSRNRLFNALCFSRTPGDTDLVLAPLDRAVADRLVGRGLLLYYGIEPTTYLWPAATVPDAVERASLVAAGVSTVDAVMADWNRAQENIRAKTYGLAAILVGLLWSGIPSACCLGAIVMGMRWVPRLVLAAAALYLLALLPNVMITHDRSHQCYYDVIFALLVSAPLEAVLRRRAAARAPSR